MNFLTHKLFDEDEVRQFNKQLLYQSSDWEDGRKSAGSYAAKVKDNLQLNRNTSIAESLSQLVIEKIKQSQLLKSFCLPKKIHGLTFSQMGQGQGYGMHVDNAYMSSGRSDLSFTLFLSGPDEYEGGDLSIQTLQEDRDFKLMAGEIVIYPSTSLHSVKAVTKGNRLVCVGWIHSYISDNEDRELLFGLDAGARGLLAQHGQSPQLDLIFQAYNNLLRRLGS